MTRAEHPTDAAEEAGRAGAWPVSGDPHELPGSESDGAPHRARLSRQSAHDVSRYSLEADLRLPGKRVLSSSDLGWRSVLVRESEDPDVTDGFTTAPTPDLFVAINLAGTYTIESRDLGGWRSAPIAPGSFGITRPGGNPTLRWRRQPSEQRRTLQIHLAAGLLEELAWSLDRPSLLTTLPDALLLQDPVVLALGQALRLAVRGGAHASYADQLARSLAVHLMYAGSLADDNSPAAPPVASPFVASDLGRVLAHMHDNLADEVQLDDLARLVNVSKFHFLRLFSQATGVTPHKYLIHLRLQHGALLLRTTTDSVSAVAASCGYASPSHFAATFRQQQGLTPSEYRRKAAPSPSPSPPI